MDSSTFAPCAVDATRQVQVFSYPRGTALIQVRLGQVSGFELTPFVTRTTQTAQEVQVTLAWHVELYQTANQPAPGQVLELRLDGKQLWLGFVFQINNFTLQSGTKTMTVVARSRDASPSWRNVQRITDIYPVGTPLKYICLQMAAAAMVDPTEFWIPDMPVYTVHSTTQLAQMTLWDMFTTLLQPAGYDPYVDALGRLKGISRDTQRPADVVLDDTRVISVDGGKAKPPVNILRVNWLDPNLAKVSQQGRKLADSTVTMGFFQFVHKQDVWFSSDGTQRAHNTYLVVRQSCNSGLLPVASETYRQLTDKTGRVELDGYFWSPILATASIADLIFLALVPDGVITGGFIIGGGQTIPYGRVLQNAAQVAMALVMMSIGTGVYEIWGEPFDYIHNRNKTDAYDSVMQPWEENVSEIQTDFVMNEPMAQNMAVRELLYQYRSASTWGITIVDDPRLEAGDIVQLKDGTRVYITGYSRDLTFGAPAQLKVDGFRV